jgi:citrate synthase
MVDQRRIDDQRSRARKRRRGNAKPIAARGDDGGWIDSRTAAARLGVSLRTLYAYVSRGAIRSVAGAAGRPRRYAAGDVERLRVRSEARRGHGPVAAAALRWGEPVLDSAVTAITPRGPAYRGVVAVDLVSAGASFEHAAELLWTGTRPTTVATWPRAALPVARLARLAAGAHPLDAMALVLALARIDSPREQTMTDATTDAGHGRRLIPLLAACLAANAAAMTRALGAPTVAGVVARALGCDGAEPAIDAALILLADHELNASSFAARVAASTGADPPACVAAALATLTGPRHGRAAEDIARDRDTGAGFGHPLYPGGDPRAPPLLAIAATSPLRRARALVARVRASSVPPSVDGALAALVLGLGAPPSATSGMFAVARCAGWLAHAAEQRAADYVLRPRARYVGPPVT